MSRDPGTPQVDQYLTPSAHAVLDRYLAAVERRMKEAGTFSEEAIDDLRAHVYAELATSSPADEGAVRAVIQQLGAPEDVAASAEPSEAPPRKTAIKITIVLVVIFPFAIAATLLAPYWMIWQTRRHPPTAPGPAGISEGALTAPGPAGISEGAALWDTRAFYEEPFERIGDVRFANLDGNPGLELGVLEDRRALFLNLDGSVKSKVFFDDSVFAPRFVDTDFDGRTEYLAPGGGFQTVALLNDLGHLVWSRPEPGASRDTLPPFDTAAGDVDGDGRSEFAMVTMDGIDLVDAGGRQRWHRSALNGTKVFIIDLDENGRRGIVHNQTFEGIVVRDKNGDVVAKGNTVASGPFTAVAWPAEGRRSHLLIAEKDRLRVLTYQGATASTLPVPGLTVRHSAMDPRLYACHANLAPTHPNILVVLIEFSSSDTSLLLGFEGETCIYREVLTASCSALTTARDAADQSDRLFIACQHKVIEYRRSK